jgi:hypothetical protein
MPEFKLLPRAEVQTVNNSSPLPGKSVGFILLSKILFHEKLPPTLSIGKKSREFIGDFVNIFDLLEEICLIHPFN